MEYRHEAAGSATGAPDPGAAAVGLWERIYPRINPSAAWRPPTFPPGIRRALKRRDGGCRFPGCTCTRFVDAHHIQHGADGGETSMSNLVLLCKRHHRLVHEEGFGLNRGADGAFNFSLPDGTPIPPGPDTHFRGNGMALKVRNKELDLDITPDTPIPKWCGVTMDNDLAVLGLLQRE